MNIKEMHYDFKVKINKLDSQQYRNIKVPEIDWKINEAIEIFKKIVAEPKYATKLGFETSQRTIDDIRTVVVNGKQLTKIAKSINFDIYELPIDYQYYVGAESIEMSKSGCSVFSEKVFVRQHDDNFQSSAYDKSSFLWRELNIRFFEEGIKVFTNNEFTTDKFLLNYIRESVPVNNSESFVGGQYINLAGVTLSTNVDCDLPKHTHSEIVDIAVLLTTGNLQIPDYQIKINKLNMNQLI